MSKAQVTFNYTLYPPPAVIHSQQASSWEEVEKSVTEGVGIKPTLSSKSWDRVTWPGMYPLYYLTKDGGCLCPECANENMDLTTGDDPQWQITDVDANYEDTTLYCDNCQKFIPNGNGDDVNEEES